MARRLQQQHCEGEVVPNNRFYIDIYLLMSALLLQYSIPLVQVVLSLLPLVTSTRLI